MTALLETKGLSVHLPVGGTSRPILRNVSLSVETGESIGLVGESGSGKSTTLRAIARLLPPSADVSGVVDFDGTDLLQLGDSALRRFRSTELAVVFQDPAAAINPVRKLGDALTEGCRFGQGLSKAESRRRAIELLDEVGIAGATQRMRQYPHEFSGGMLQRVMLACALAGEPRMLLADEPTASLDVTTQSEVMGLLDQLRRDRGLALVCVSHNLELAAGVCDRTYVMYAGEIVECQQSTALHERPLHPYTAGLLGARPSVESSVERLAAIPGRPLAAFEVGGGCSFTTRCIYCEERCEGGRPPLEPLNGGLVRCIRTGELGAELTAHRTTSADA